nr:nuclear poly(A) polymerase 4-like isoform X1 [Tanacetum cinerariifolium]
MLGKLQCHPYPHEYSDPSKQCLHGAFFMGLQRKQGEGSSEEVTRKRKDKDTCVNQDDCQKMRKSLSPQSRDSVSPVIVNDSGHSSEAELDDGREREGNSQGVKVQEVFEAI